MVGPRTLGTTTSFQALLIRVDCLSTAECAAESKNMPTWATLRLMGVSEQTLLQLNPRHSVCKTDALTTELQPHLDRRRYIKYFVPNEDGALITRCSLVLCPLSLHASIETDSRLASRWSQHAKRGRHPTAVSSPGAGAVAKHPRM